MAVIMQKYRVELVRESSKSYDLSNKVVSTPYDAYVIAEEIFNMSNQAEEIIAILTLDIKRNMIGAFEVARGSLNSALTSSREIFKRALLNNAHGIILIHNHPSWDVSPSQDDIKFTKRIKEAGDLLSIPLVDHLIIGGTYLSFVEQKLM